MLTNNLSLIKEGFKGMFLDTIECFKNFFKSKERRLIDALAIENAKLKAELEQLQRRLGM